MNKPASPANVASNEGLGVAVHLVRCPLCGANDGYTLDEGSTFRWWSVCCTDCGQEVSEARASLVPTPLTPPARTALADAAWNAAGAYAERLRAALTELVSLKDLKDAIDAPREIWGVDGVAKVKAICLAEYSARKETAWAVAQDLVTPNAEVSGPEGVRLKERLGARRDCRRGARH
jgi:hypothetical protein